MILASFILTLAGCQANSSSTLFSDSEREEFVQRMANLGVEVNEPLTQEIWETLDNDAKEGILFWSQHRDRTNKYWAGMKVIDFVPRGVSHIEIEDIHYAPYREYVEAIDVDYRSAVHMDVSDSNNYYAIVGVPVINNLFLLVREADNKVFGAEMTYYQDGCTMPNEQLAYFADQSEAEAAGCDFNDVNWSTSATYDFDAVRISYGAYWLEWSGH